MSIAEMKAIAIFEKYINSAYTFHAEHDCLFGPHIDHMRMITDDDKQALEQLGWYINRDGCWQHCFPC